VSPKITAAVLRRVNKITVEILGGKACPKRSAQRNRLKEKYINSFNGRSCLKR